MKKPVNAFSVLRQRPDIDEYKSEVPSRVLLATSPMNTGVLLDYVGRGAAELVEAHGLVGLADLGLDDAPRGLAIWEGDWRVAADECTPIGRFRRLTDTEWTALRDGRVLWDDSLWLRAGAAKCADPDCFEAATPPRPLCHEHWSKMPPQAAADFVNAIDAATWAPRPGEAISAARTRATLAYRGVK